MASHVRRCSKLGVDAPHHFFRISIFFDPRQRPLGTQPRWARSLALAGQDDLVKNRPGSELPPPPRPISHPRDSWPSLPFSTLIPTGVRTDSGEERFFRAYQGVWPCVTSPSPARVDGVGEAGITPQGGPVPELEHDAGLGRGRSIPRFLPLVRGPIFAITSLDTLFNGLVARLRRRSFNLACL